MNHFKDNFFNLKSFLGPFGGKHHNSSLQICLCIRQRKTNIIHYLNLYNSDKKGLFLIKGCLRFAILRRNPRQLKIKKIFYLSEQHMLCQNADHYL